jgi:curved DNA-binding protein
MGRHRGSFDENSGVHDGFSTEDFASRGQDVEGDILVPLDEVARGSVRRITVKRAGACDRCNGTGERGGKTCSTCGGSGQTEKAETYQVKIPAGVTDGQRLRVAGRGAAGTGGGEAGDLYLRVRLQKHPDFDVDGHNLIYDAPIAPWEAVLGGNLTVPTLGEKVSIRIPAGTKNGQKMRVRGRGLPKRESGAGDLFVRMHIEVPEKVSEAERKLWEQLARESRFNPRQS